MSSFIMNRAVLGHYALTDILTSALIFTKNWASSNGLNVNVKKTELVLFARINTRSLAIKQLR